VSVRSVRNWDHGRSRVPWMAVRLMRILRNGELLPAAWSGWRLWDDTLWSPEGKGFKAYELSWWSNTAAMARLWREAQRLARLSAAEGPPVVARVRDEPCATDGALAPRSDSPEQPAPTSESRPLPNALVNLVAAGRGGAQRPPLPGLVILKTSGTPAAGIQQRRGLPEVSDAG
jgi:hypothetical protein